MERDIGARTRKKKGCVKKLIEIARSPQALGHRPTGRFLLQFCRCEDSAMTLQTSTPVFFVNVTDRQRALGFYVDTLGLDLRSTDDFGDFLDLGTALLRMTVIPGHQPQTHPIFGWNVGDIASAIQDLRRRGVDFIIYDGMGQDEQGIWTAPDGGAKVAFFADPDGNLLSLSTA
jgi:catechol 2,3-dioxygenase-like lactoylglutathione lyase family enzyme